MKKLRNLLLVTLEDPYNPLSWSGTPYYTRLALEQELDHVYVLSGLKPKRSPVHVALRAALGQSRYPLYLTPAAQKQFAVQTERAIAEHKPDAVLAISSHCLLYLPVPKIPVFMMTDAPWLTWRETYAAYGKPMPLWGPRFARLEAKAARHATGLIFPSQWAGEEAQRLYDVPPSKIHIHPLGANWAPQVSDDALASVIQSRSLDPLELLYIGKDWERKGGPLALEIARELKQRGRKLTLHIVGCTPEIPSDLHNVVKVHGLLRSSDPGQKAELEQLFLHSHFLIVPTQAECYGLVFAEAHAFGLPSISRAVHAVPSIVQDGITGILEPLSAPASAYVERIFSVIDDPNAYRTMAMAARSRYEKVLTWKPFAQGVIQAIEATL